MGLVKRTALKLAICRSEGWWLGGLAVGELKEDRARSWLGPELPKLLSCLTSLFSEVDFLLLTAFLAVASAAGKSAVLTIVSVLFGSSRCVSFFFNSCGSTVLANLFMYCFLRSWIWLEMSTVLWTAGFSGEGFLSLSSYSL